jgi:hypothetical protein
MLDADFEIVEHVGDVGRLAAGPGADLDVGKRDELPVLVAEPADQRDARLDIVGRAGMVGRRECVSGEIGAYPSEVIDVADPGLSVFRPQSRDALCDRL